MDPMTQLRMMQDYADGLPPETVCERYNVSWAEMARVCGHTHPQIRPGLMDAEHDKADWQARSVGPRVIGVD